jgi:hypothetical protein
MIGETKERGRVFGRRRFQSMPANEWHRKFFRHDSDSSIFENFTVAIEADVTVPAIVQIHVCFSHVSESWTVSLFSEDLTEQGTVLDEHDPQSVRVVDADCERMNFQSCLESHLIVPYGCRKKSEP